MFQEPDSCTFLTHVLITYIFTRPKSKHDVEMRPGRGQAERRERMDRDKLKDLLFEQFEKHQVTNCKVKRISKRYKITLSSHFARSSFLFDHRESLLIGEFGILL